MGAWGEGPFDNDGALDWLAGLGAAPDLTYVREALALAVGDPDAPEYLERDDAAAAIAAAEIVAALQGYARFPLPDRAVSWLMDHCELPGGPLVPLAREAVTRVLTSSELQELWAESSTYDAWKAETEGLLKRLVVP